MDLTPSLSSGNPNDELVLYSTFSRQVLGRNGGSVTGLRRAATPDNGTSSAVDESDTTNIGSKRKVLANGCQLCDVTHGDRD